MTADSQESSPHLGPANPWLRAIRRTFSQLPATASRGIRGRRRRRDPRLRDRTTEVDAVG